jgi:hypothetical protein
MNGGLEEVLMRTVDEVCGAVRPWIAPAVEAEVKRQLSGDPASESVGPPKRETRTGSGLQLTLTACGFGPRARIRIALEAMTAIESALGERLQELVRAEITRQRPISERAQRDFDEWAAASRDRSARYATLAQLRAAGRKFAVGGKGV